MKTKAVGKLVVYMHYLFFLFSNFNNCISWGCGNTMDSHQWSWFPTKLWLFRVYSYANPPIVSLVIISFVFFLAFCRWIYLEFVRGFSLIGSFCDGSLGNFFGSCWGFCATSCFGDGLLGNLVSVWVGTLFGYWENMGK